MERGLGGADAPVGIVRKNFRGGKMFNGQIYNSMSELFFLGEGERGGKFYVDPGCNFYKYGSFGNQQHLYLRNLKYNCSRFVWNFLGKFL